MPRLTRHPDTPCDAVRALEAEAARASDGLLELRYRLTGDLAGLTVPPPQVPARTDELWRHLCFEAFVRGAAGEAYLELNLAPSRQWAAYRFDGYRQGMTPAPIGRPTIELGRGEGGLELTARIDLGGLPELAGPWRVGLTAVVEEAGGRISYWALEHAAGKPDFHAPDCLALELPAPLSP